MKAVFIELPAFARHRDAYVSAAAFDEMQKALMENPAVGDLIRHSGGLRKLRFRDQRRGKGRRGGLRIIYYWWETGRQFWLFTIYDKDEAVDLTPAELKRIRALLETELRMRRPR